MVVWWMAELTSHRHVSGYCVWTPENANPLLKQQLPGTMSMSAGVCRTGDHNQGGAPCCPRRPSARRGRRVGPGRH